MKHTLRGPIMTGLIILWLVCILGIQPALAETIYGNAGIIYTNIPAKADFELTAVTNPAYEASLGLPRVYDELTFTDKTTPPTPKMEYSSYDIDFGDKTPHATGEGAPPATVKHKYLSEGQYTVSWKVESKHPDYGKRVSTKTKTLTIFYEPPVVMDINGEIHVWDYTTSQPVSCSQFMANHPDVSTQDCSCPVDVYVTDLQEVTRADIAGEDYSHIRKMSTVQPDANGKFSYSYPMEYNTKLPHLVFMPRCTQQDDELDWQTSWITGTITEDGKPWAGGKRHDQYSISKGWCWPGSPTCVYSITKKIVFQLRLLKCDFDVNKDWTKSGEFVTIRDHSLGGIKKWSVDFSDGGPVESYTAFPKTWSHKYKTDGWFDIAMTVGDGTNERTCHDLYIVNFVGKQTTTKPIAFGFTPAEGKMAPLTVQFYASPGAVKYDWDFGDGGSSNQMTTTHTFTKTGIYKVRCKVTDSDNRESFALTPFYDDAGYIIIGAQPDTLLYVASSPLNVKVYLDDVYQGDTPVSIPHVSTNTDHTLRLDSGSQLIGGRTVILDKGTLAKYKGKTFFLLIDLFKKDSTINPLDNLDPADAMGVSPTPAFARLLDESTGEIGAYEKTEAADSHEGLYASDGTGAASVRQQSSILEMLFAAPQAVIAIFQGSPGVGGKSHETVSSTNPDPTGKNASSDQMRLIVLPGTTGSNVQVTQPGSGLVIISKDAERPDPGEVSRQPSQPEQQPEEQPPREQPVVVMDNARSVVTTACQPGQVQCSGACTDTATDLNNCGSCGTACSWREGEVCVSGRCTTRCPAGQTPCNRQCVNLQTDNSNCGSCGNTCAGREGFTCIQGACKQETPAITAEINPAVVQAAGAAVMQSRCAEGTTYCNGACVDLQKDRNNCGQCGTVCDRERGETCYRGTCMMVVS